MKVTCTVSEIVKWVVAQTVFSLLQGRGSSSGWDSSHLTARTRQHVSPTRTKETNLDETG